MLVTIGSRKPTPPPILDGIGLLEECHERIRTFTDLARRLAKDRNAEPILRAEAARSVHRYFATALPMHVLDEDTSLMPRLWAVADVPLQDAMVSMADQHGDIEETIADLLPEWRDASLAGRVMPAFVREETVALDLMLTVHLDLEESVIFPAARRLLDASTLTLLAAEIRARRTLADPSAFHAKPTGARP
jgi:hypothetical protein